MYKKIHHKTKELRTFIRSSQQALVIFLEIIYGIFLTVSSVVVFWTIRDQVFEKEFFYFDQQLVHFFYNLRTPLLNSIMIFISYLGAEIAVFLAIILSVFLLMKKHTREAFLMCFILGMAVGITNILKTNIQRPRPQYFPLVFESTYSFPSGHSMTSFVFYTTLSYFIFHFTRRKYFSLVTSTFFMILVGMIGISRIYLGVHYPSDVLAGYLGGLAWFSSVLLIDKTLIFYKLFKERNEIIY